MPVISLGPNESKTVTVAGGRFYYESGLGPIRVRTIGDNPTEFNLNPGMGFQNEKDENFFGVVLENVSGYAQDVGFIISYREVFDNRVSFADVIVNAETVLFERSFRGDAYGGVSFKGSSPVGNYPHVSIRNPVGSGKTLIVNSVTISGGGSDYVLAGLTNAAAELGSASVLALSSPQVGWKKYIPSSNLNSVAIFDNFHVAGNLPNAKTYWRGFDGSGGPYEVKFREPVVLMPDNALLVYSWNASTSLVASFEFVQWDSIGRFK